MRAMWIVVAVAVGVAVARVAVADPADDAGKAFAAFIDGLAKGQAGSAESVVMPFSGDGEGLGSDDMSRVADLELGKVSGITAVVSPGGKSAWLAADVARAKGSALRATAVLAAGDTGWHVVAAHLSIAAPNTKQTDCGALSYEWGLASDIDKEAEPAVTALAAALDAKKLGDVMSDDKRAIAIGSAPKERWTGGAAIKAAFKKLELTAPPLDGGKVRAVAGATADGQLVYATMPVIAPDQYCTEYRVLFVLANEKGTWRVVSQHYSERSTLP